MAVPAVAMMLAKPGDNEWEDDRAAEPGRPTASTGPVGVVPPPGDGGSQTPHEATVGEAVRLCSRGRVPARTGRHTGRSTGQPLSEVNLPRNTRPDGAPPCLPD